MLRKALLAAGVAAAAAENCGGALSIDPRYCIGSPDGVNPYCTATSLQVGDTVPLRIRMTNNANYEDTADGTVYVPGELQANKMVQIAFACLGGPECNVGSAEALSYPDPPVPGPLGGEPAGTVVWDAAQGAKFEMGPCNPDTFKGVNMCTEEFLIAGRNACGCVTLGPTNIPATGDEYVTIGNVYLRANKFIDEPIAVHISADEGMLETIGGICAPEELTASGTGSAQGEYTKYSPPPPPPPPSPPPPPPPPTQPAACVKYGKCQWCDDPDIKCWHGGDGIIGARTVDGVDVPADCFVSCQEMDSYVCEGGEFYVPGRPTTFCSTQYTKRWGECSSNCPVSASKDPHLHLPHGGIADFRGQDNTVFNLLSAKTVAFNVLFEKGDFAWATRLVHGTKMAAGYWVITTNTGKTLTVEYAANKFDPVALVHEDEHRDVQVRAGTPALVVDDVIVSMIGKTLTVRNAKWVFTATTAAYPFGKLEQNKNKVLLDVSVQPLYDADADPVAPHGILGQSYDQDKLAVSGKVDEQKAGESTTAAQAEGAIEGSWEEYIVPSKFSTDFKYSRFGLAKAAPRDVSKLTGEKKAASDAAVGASDQQ